MVEEHGIYSAVKDHALIESLQAFLRIYPSMRTLFAMLQCQICQQSAVSLATILLSQLILAN